jgi:hypothetical protein
LFRRPIAFLSFRCRFLAQTSSPCRRLVIIVDPTSSPRRLVSAHRRRHPNIAIVFVSLSSPSRRPAVIVVDILSYRLGVVYHSASFLRLHCRRRIVTTSSSSPSRRCLSVSVVGVFSPSSLYRRRYFNDLVAASQIHDGVVV